VSVVHFIPCRGDEPPERIGALALTAARLAAPAGFRPVRHLLDAPLRASAAAAFAAWSGPVAAAWPEDADGPDLLVAARGSLHARSGWEGVLHALAVRGASPAELSDLQRGVQPRVERDICGGCGMCVTLCGNAGIKHNGHVAVIRPENCLACGDCLAECYLEALKFPVGGTAELLRRLGEAAAARVRGARSVLSVLFAVKPPARRLDTGPNRVPQPDLGVLAGTDPVAVDAAACALAAAAFGRGLRETSGCPADPEALLETAAGAGAGGTGHELVAHRPEPLAG